MRRGRRVAPHESNRALALQQREERSIGGVVRHVQLRPLGSLPAAFAAATRVFASVIIDETTCRISWRVKKGSASFSSTRRSTNVSRRRTSVRTRSLGSSSLAGAVCAAPTEGFPVVHESRRMRREPRPPGGVTPIVRQQR